MRLSGLHRLIVFGGLLALACAHDDEAAQSGPGSRTRLDGGDAAAAQGGSAGGVVGVGGVGGIGAMGGHGGTGSAATGGWDGTGGHPPCGLDCPDGTSCAYECRGIDLGWYCKPPLPALAQGHIPCGDEQCNIASQYCFADATNVEGCGVLHSCEELPPECDGISAARCCEELRVLHKLDGGGCAVVEGNGVEGVRLRIGQYARWATYGPEAQP